MPVWRAGGGGGLPSPRSDRCDGDSSWPDMRHWCGSAVTWDALLATEEVGQWRRRVGASDPDGFRRQTGGGPRLSSLGQRLVSGAGLATGGRRWWRSPPSPEGVGLSPAARRGGDGGTSPVAFDARRPGAGSSRPRCSIWSDGLRFGPVRSGQGQCDGRPVAFATPAIKIVRWFASPTLPFMLGAVSRRRGLRD